MDPKHFLYGKLKVYIKTDLFFASNNNALSSKKVTSYYLDFH